MHKTFEEVFTHKRIEVSHLRIFGCPVYFHVPNEKMNKLKDLGKKCMFVGYCDNSKAYRIYVPSQRTIEFSRDVTFDENAALGKARDTPPPANVESQDDALDAQEDLEPKPDLVDEPMEPMDRLDPPPSDRPARKRPLWIRDILQDVDRHVAPEGTFREKRNFVCSRDTL